MSTDKSQQIWSERLPEALRPLFWDIEFDRLDWQEHHDFIIRRVLVSGSWKNVMGLRSALGDTALRDWMERQQGRGLSAQQLRYWQLILDLPEDQVTNWLRTNELRIWKEGVRVSFLEFGYPLLRPLVQWEALGCVLAAPDDLAAMKLLAVAQRGAKKDFFDLHALMLSGLSLEQMLESYRQKFSVADVSRVLYSLCYFDDADLEPLPRMLTDVSWTEVKSAIQRRVLAFSASGG